MSHCIFLVGATGTGKSEVALHLARQRGAAVLALDAMQVYRGADLGTSKPTLSDRKEIRHGGLDLIDFGEDFDVAQYLKHAESFLREQHEARRDVVIVGGTGLYFRALTQGLCEAPPGSEALRAELQTLSVTELEARLTRVDPEMVARLDRANPRRLARAIEVMETTGRSLHTWRQETRPPLITDYQAWWIQREVDELRERLQQRVERMFKAGWIEEVRRLIARFGPEKVKAFPGIGYRDLADFLAGRVTETIVRSNILVATRQYAKRQLTWFAREPNLQSAMLTRDLPLPETLVSLF